MWVATMLRGIAWLLCGLLGWVGMAAALELTPEEAAGKRIYLHGLGSSDAAIEALVGVAATRLPATSLPCAGCHGSDGRGRAEGGVRPPEITWRRLSMSYGQRLASGREHPAYDDGAFARAIGEGLDPAGNRLSPAMPRFVMSLRDLRNLTAYIKRLENDRDPGLHEEVLRLGTLLPGSGPLAGLGQTVQALLEGVLAGLNESGGIHGRRLELVVVDPGADRASAEAALGELLEQLDVFALVAPLAPALEERFAELLAASGTPLVGPLLQFAAADSPLVFEPLPGLREQLFALGDFARTALAIEAGATLIVYPLDDRYRALAEALSGRLQVQGWQQVELFGYPPGTAVANLPGGADLQALFYLGQGEDFVALATLLAQGAARPYLFAASSQVAGAVLRIAPPFSGRLFLAYPFLPADWTPAGTAALQAVRQRGGLDGRHATLQVSAYSAALVLAEGLKRSGRDASREKLLNALENLHAFPTGVTPVLGFGPGRRVGAPGAHIVAVDLEQGLFRPTGRYLKVGTP